LYAKGLFLLIFFCILLIKIFFIWQMRLTFALNYKNPDHMRKIYASFALMLGTAVCSAQIKQNYVQEAYPAETQMVSPVTKTTTSSPASSFGAPIWSEDFANGFPAGWTVSDTSGICPWTYSLDGSWGYFNGTSGTAAAAAIKSTTAANGFLISDVDSANNKNYGQPSGTTYKYLST
jgi:hypothetical protein